MGEEKGTKPSIGAGSDKSARIVKKTVAEEEQAPRFLASTESMQCPGSSAWVHASAWVSVTAEATCDKVEEEIKARVDAANGWTDPHNGGIYSLLSGSHGTLNTQRTTNPKKSVGGKLYTDKQTFTLTTDGATCRIDA